MSTWRLISGSRSARSRWRSIVAALSLRLSPDTPSEWYATRAAQPGWSYVILLPGNNLEGAYFVVEKVKSRFGRRLDEELPEVQFQISAEKLT